MLSGTSRLHGKVAVVTGATSGIGHATCARLISDGARVVFCGRRESLGRELESLLGPNSRFVAADVTKEEDVRRVIETAVEKFGRLDVLFNNAGAPGPPGDVATVASAGFDAAVEVLFRSVFYGVKHAAPIMKLQRSGAIVSNASVAAHLGGYATSHIYSACKSAIVGLSRSVALELAPYGIRVNTVSPGAIATGIFGRGAGLDADAADATAPVVEKMLVKAQPILRAGRPEDVAAAVAFLASCDAEFITGQDLVIDGGMIAGRRYGDTVAAKQSMNRVLKPE